MQQKLPLRYTIDKTKRATGVSMYRDLKTEESIAALAAHGFAKYGQPLNTFPQLFTMSKKKTQDIINIFKDAYKKIVPIINAKGPSQSNIDKAFEDFVKQGRIAAVAYILPKASEKVINDAALEKLSPFATPYACTKITSLFPEYGSKEATKACAKKASKYNALEAVRSAQEKRNFINSKFLAPFLSPLGIIELLESSSSPEQLDPDRVKEILGGLPSDLADDALRIAIRGNNERRGKNIGYLLPKASKAAIDEVYLFAKRIKFSHKLLEKSASATVKAQGKEIERAVSAK